MARPVWHPESLIARLPFLRRRALLTGATRAVFYARGVTAVATPEAGCAPGASRSSWMPSISPR